jgi:hypothetical protein
LAIKRTSSNSLVNAPKMSTGFSSAAIPNAPTIGTATATSDVAATVEYTAAVLGATGTTFTATSNPSSITGTGSSPITVTGLTASTSYTFTVTAGNANGTSAASSASNSITTSAPLNSYESIATYTVGGTAQDSIEFTSIPATYTHLQLRYIARTNRNEPDDGFSIQFNGDTTAANYKYHYFAGSGAIRYSGNDPEMNVPYVGAANAAANIFGIGICDILDYRNTNKNTTVRILGGHDRNGGGWTALNSGLWRNTAAVTSLKIQTNALGNFVQYSSFALYGIKGA